MFKKHIEYLRDNPQQRWFKRKIWGWGWVPVTWQGWLTTLAYAALASFLALMREESIAGDPDSGSNFLVLGLPFILLTAAFVSIAYWKGERPAWQWGLQSGENRAGRTESGTRYTFPMTTISPWINFNGNAEEAFTFYKSVFGGEFTNMVRFKDVAGPELPVAEDDADKLMQIVLPISGSNALIGNDVPAFMGAVSENENRSKIRVLVESKEEAERICNGLSAGGQVEVPLGESAWGTCFSMFRDKYGIEWVVESSAARPAEA